MGFNGASIQEIMNKIKDIIRDDTVFYSLLIILVAVSAYGLGLRAGSVNEDAIVAAQIQLVQEPDTSGIQVQNDTGPTIVGSKNGSKYHYLWCPGASQIKDENKVFFDSVAQAMAAGYSPAANCEGLE